MENSEVPEFTNFILAGHSFGGYLIGFYSLKYFKHIKKLLFLSQSGGSEEGSKVTYVNLFTIFFEFNLMFCVFNDLHEFL